MNNVSILMEAQLKDLSGKYILIANQAAAIYKKYFATDATTLVSALATDATPATVSTALNKGQFLAGITLCEQLGNFFNNSAVTTADYLATVNTLISGDTPAGSALSPGVESLGQDLLSLAQSIISYYQSSVITYAAYNQNGFAQCVSAISADQVMPGCSSTGTHLITGITLVLQFIKMMTNQAVSAATYFDTAISWTQG